MPGNDAAVFSRLAEELIVPEANAATQELRCGNQECGIPQHIMKAGLNAPRAESVKQHGRRVGGFVRIVFVEQLIARMVRIGEIGKFGAKVFYLSVVQ